MKHLYILLAFLAGVAVATVFWGFSLHNYKLELVATDLGRLEEEAIVSKHIFSYLDNPDSANRDYLSFISSNALTCFPTNVDSWDQRFPYLQIKRRYEAKSKSLENYWREREARVATNNMAGELK